MPWVEMSSSKALLAESFQAAGCGTEGSVRRSDGNVITEDVAGCAEQLARFFPHLVAQREPVRVAAMRPGSATLREATILEFGGAEHGIFLSTLPLEFADRVKIERGEKARVAEATVVAVQYHEGKKAVAVRFSRAQDYRVNQP
jgi:hypothetical protein